MVILPSVIGKFRRILLKNSQIGISRFSAKSTPLLKLLEARSERFLEAALGPEAHFGGTPRKNSSVALCG